MRNKTTINRICLPAVLSFFLQACNDKKESIPFPNDTGPKPVTTAFKFTEVKDLKWPVNSIPLRTQIKKIDFDKIPERPFDSSGFISLAKKPEEVPFDWDKLPDTAFDYDNLPSKPLRFKISVLETPQLIKADLHIKP